MVRVAAWLLVHSSPACAGGVPKILAKGLAATYSIYVCTFNIPPKAAILHMHVRITRIGPHIRSGGMLILGTMALPMIASIRYISRSVILVCDWGPGTGD